MFLVLSSINKKTFQLPIFVISKMEKEFDIVVVGSIVMDLISYSSRIPKLGETLFGSDFKTGFGGKGANQCVASARLGAKCAFVGKIGDDDNGKRYYENLRAEGVNVEGILTEKGKPTGVASIMVGESDGQNVIVVVPGANDAVTPQFVEAHGKRFVSSAKVVIVQLEVPIESTHAALRLAKESGGSISIFNPAPGSPNIPKELLALADIICLNETEAELATGINSISSVSDAEAAIKDLLENFSANKVIITLGSQGAVFWDNDERKMCFIEAPKVKAVDTTGAGDCFIGTLAYCVARGDKFSDAIRQAVFNATDSVLRKGTQTSFPSCLK